MRSKPLLISGLTSSSLAGAGLIGSLLSVEKTKVTFKDKLIQQGYEEIRKNDLGSKISLLRQYSDFPKNEITDLGDWCEKGKKILDEDSDEKFKKQFKEYCFDTVASKIHRGNFLILEYSAEEQNADQGEWNESFKKFQADYKSSNKPSSIWESTDDLTKFKEQCKKNERAPYISEEELVFKEVEKYCTRLIGSDSLSLG